MEVDWLLLGCRAVASWNMPPGSRRRTLLHRSATKTLWADSYTFAKTERPSLDSAPPAAADAETLAAEWADAAAMEVASAAQLLEAVPDDRSTSPMFVPLLYSQCLRRQPVLTLPSSFPIT
jgi:uncharacterized damage-inducible protein DinB